MFLKDLTLLSHISFLLLYVDFNNFNSVNFDSLRLVFLEHGFDDTQFYLFLITFLITFLIVFFGKNFNRFSENNFLQTQPHCFYK